MKKIYGHDANLNAFRRVIDGGRIHHGWIFSGPRGVGKATFASEAARLLVDPDRRFASMIDTRSHPDIIWISRLPKEPPKEGEEIDAQAELKRGISIDQVREMQSRLNTRPSIADRRVVIIDAADDLERGGANALLKSLEEPPIGTFFMLLSHSSDRLLPTIRSRCQMMRFEPLDERTMREAMIDLVPDVTESEIATLVKLGRGLPGQAVTLAGFNFGAIESLVDDIIASGDPTSILRNKLAEQLSTKNSQAVYEAFLRHVPVRIAAEARTVPIAAASGAVEAFHAADRLAARALGLTLDKPAVVLQMAHMLAQLRQAN